MKITLRRHSLSSPTGAVMAYGEASRWHHGRAWTVSSLFSDRCRTRGAHAYRRARQPTPEARTPQSDLRRDPHLDLQANREEIGRSNEESRTDSETSRLDGATRFHSPI